MKPMKFSLRNLIFYVLGCVFIAFGVVMMIRSGLGTSSWDTLHYSLHRLFGMTVGTATIVVAMIFTAFVIWMNRSFRYILMTIPILLVGSLIDLFDLVLLVDFTVTVLWQQIPVFTLGLLLLPLGGSLLIISTFPAGVFDEFMLGLMKMLNTDKLVLVRVIMELSAVTVAVILSFIAGDKFGTFNVGTLVFSLLVGTLVKLYLSMWQKIGYYEISPTKELES